MSLHHVAMGEHFALVSGTESRKRFAGGTPPHFQVLYSTFQSGKHRGLNLPELNCLLHIALFCKLPRTSWPEYKETAAHPVAYKTVTHPKGSIVLRNGSRYTDALRHKKCPE